MNLKCMFGFHDWDKGYHIGPENLLMENKRCQRCLCGSIRPLQMSSYELKTLGLLMKHFDPVEIRGDGLLSRILPNGGYWRLKKGRNKGKFKKWVM